VSLPAGARRVPLAPFIALTTAGCALWAIAFVLVGAALGRRLVDRELDPREGPARRRADRRCAARAQTT